jgi:hypothetical protein
MTSPSIDGYAIGGGGYNNTTCSATLTTTTAGIIVVAVSIETANNGHCQYAVSGISDTAGLTWQRHFQFVNQLSGDDFRDCEIWWAVSPGAQTSDVITTTSNGATDGTAIVVFGVQNCTGWDTNLQLPQTTTGNNNQPYSTDLTDDLILAFEFSGNNGTTPTGGSPGPTTFTLIDTVRDTSGFGNAGLAVYSATGSGPISSGTVNSGGGYIMVIDALTNDAISDYAAPTIDGSNRAYPVDTYGHNILWSRANQLPSTRGITLCPTCSP